MKVNLAGCLRGAKPHDKKIDSYHNYLPLHAKNTSPYYGEGDKGDRVTKRELKGVRLVNNLIATLF